MINESQKTISKQVSVTGVGLHSGVDVNITLRPAPTDYGIVFRRVDVERFDNIVRADYRNVTKTQLGTVISNTHGTMVSTIEHLMAALWGVGVDNLLVDINGPEVPIMDGSSAPFIKMVEVAGIEDQQAKRKVVQVLKTVEVMEEDKFARISPSDDFSIDLEIDFGSKVISNQKRVYSSRVSFADSLAAARTFGFTHEVEYLRSIGLARGGSLDNAVVIDGDKVVNKDGLRYDDEFVRHKLLDCIGDIYLAGKRIMGNVTAYKTGHKLNNQLLHTLFSDSSAYKIV